MRKSSIETIIRALEDARARYLVVGGLAVVAHGFVQFTADLNLVLDLEPAALRRALEALGGLGYRPRAPVDLLDFADPAKRAEWARLKDLTVFSLFSPAHPATEIDLFVEMPVDAEAAFRAAVRLELAPDLHMTCVDRARLIEMKRKAGRPQDLEDIRMLKELHPEAGEARDE